jgi:hypothetical protein
MSSPFLVSGVVGGSFVTPAPDLDAASWASMIAHRGGVDQLGESEEGPYVLTPFTSGEVLGEGDSSQCRIASRWLPRAMLDEL